MSTLKSFREHLESIKNLDQSDLDYYESEYAKLKNLDTIRIVVSDYDGVSTKHHTLKIESLIFLVKLVEKMNGAK